jgi:CRP-like cAMP-binding protein
VSTRRRIREGVTLARVGDEATFMCVLQSGEMVVYLGEWDAAHWRRTGEVGPSATQLGETLGRGALWGEVALAGLPLEGDRGVAPARRTANVRSVTPVEARMLTFAAVGKIRRDAPEPINAILVGMLGRLVRRLTDDVQRLDSREPGDARIRAELLRVARLDITGEGFVNLSQADLATVTGLQRARVNELLSKERASKRVSTRPGAAGLWVALPEMAAEVEQDQAHRRNRQS